MKDFTLNKAFKQLGIKPLVKNDILPSLYLGDVFTYGKKELQESFSPIDKGQLTSYKLTSKKELHNAIDILQENFTQWSEVPAPKRGELIRVFAQKVRDEKETLAYIITLETGKIYEEALGEVQEVIDVCDFAVGLSRQLYGLTIASERYRHKMIEQWHPLGIVGIISAFNFPMAVWAWNAMLALVCGNTLIWKPSSQAPLSAIALHLLLQKTLKEFPEFPQTLSCVALIDSKTTQLILKDPRVRLVSATGSVAMGKKVAPVVSARLGRVLLELGGNNAMIVTPSANLELTLRAVLFSAVGTAGQRCTSLRRLFIHKSIFKEVQNALVKAYKTISIGNPLKPSTLMGPLINDSALENMLTTLKKVPKQKGEILYGGKSVKIGNLKGNYVTPALVKINHEAKIVHQETFAPILYLIEYDDFKEVLKVHNSVAQGLSSAIFTSDVKEAELFTSSIGSDCGIANVNIGTSGAEIGGAFGGEKETGGGRESGSDSWKNYMRRVTNTINYSDEIPLAQGIKFDI